MSIENLQEYYANLLPLEYKWKTKARATIKLLTKQAVADDLATQVLYAFDLDTAVGDQLDTIGKYIGLPRRIGAGIHRPFFSFSGYTSGVQPNGFYSYGTKEYTAIFASYRDAASGRSTSDLNDTDYRLMLYLKIFDNMMTSSLKDIVDYLQVIFPNQIQVVDNRNMTLTYLVDIRLTIADSTLLPYLPRPMGVGISIQRVDLHVPYIRILADGSYRVLATGEQRALTI